MTGSLNSVESGPTSTGYKTVWDFTTSQCNTTIKSLARTMYQSGSSLLTPFCGVNTNNSIHNLIKNDGSTATSHIPLVFDNNTQSLYSYTAQWYASEDGWKFTVYKSEVPTRKYSVKYAANYISTPEVFTEFWIYTYPDTYPWRQVPSGNVYLYFQNAYDGYAYLVLGDNNDEGDGVVGIYKVKLSDFSFDPSPEPTLCVLEGCQLNDYKYHIVNDGKCFCMGYNNDCWYVIDVSGVGSQATIEYDSSMITTISLEDGFLTYTGYRPGYAGNFMNGVVKTITYFETDTPGTYSYCDALLYPDGTIVTDNPFYTGTTFSSSSIAHNRRAASLRDNQLMAYMPYSSSGGYTGYGYLINNYLGTICNLSSSVTKTSSTSMKITYTLTDE